MDPMLPLDQRGQQQNSRSKHHHSHSNSSVNPKPGGNDGRRQETSSHTVNRYVPGYSPLPSTTTMPLSLQHLGSAASSTDSLNSPAAHLSSVPSRPQMPGHYHSTCQSSLRTEASHPTHVTRHHHQGQPAGHASSQWEGMEASRRYAAPGATYTSQPLSTHNLSSNAYGYRLSNHDDPSPSIYSGRSTSSVNSLPPATESNLSASTVVHAYTDPKGKGRATLTPAAPIVKSSKKRVPTEIEEAVRNLGLAPPGTPSHQESHAHSPYLSVPSARNASHSAQSLSRSPSNDAASAASDAASLSGTIASSIGSTSQDAHSISAQSTKSSKKSATSKTTKKKKPKAPVTTSVIASSTSPAATTASSSALMAGASIEVKPKKKKKKEPLPTSSGKPPASTTTRSAAVSPAPASPGPSSPQPSNRTAAPVQKATRPSRSTVTSPQPTLQPSHQPARQPSQQQLHQQSHQQSSSTLPVHRPVPQAPQSQAQPSRNRHLDETALLRRFPNTAPVSASPVQANTEARPRHHPTENLSHEHAAPAASAAASAAPQPVVSNAQHADEPPPPPWTAPATTITLAFTPIHAYLSAYHDPVDQPSTSTAQAPTNPPIPDSPPPAFRSRSPSPTAAQSSSNRRTRRTSSLASEDLPDVDLDTLEERSRGYASSENELDLLNSQGRHSGTSTPPNDDAHGESSKGLRWQLRHWEAWRREGVSMEERMRRLNEWNTGAQSATGLEKSEQGETATSTPAEDVGHEERSTGLAPSPGPNLAQRQASPARTELSQLSGSGTSQPRFPSVGTIRRVRLQRFEAERQSTRSMADVVQSSPTSSQVALPRQTVSTLAPAASISVPATNTATSISDEPAAREQVRSAVLQAALGRGVVAEQHVPMEMPSSAALSNTEDASLSQQRNATVVPPTVNAPAPEAPQPRARIEASLEQSQHPHQLARQLAAQLQARQVDTATVRTPPASPGQGIGSNKPATPSRFTTPSTSTPTDGSPTKPQSSPGPKPLHKAASRISRLFRPNMGPRQQSPRKEASAETHSGPQLEEVPSPTASRATTSTQNDVEPVMTLPRAPPRLTTDPLSTDNLRRLSRRQLRSPSVHAAGSASSSSSSSESEASLSPNPEDDKSGSESDSADDESTKKPPSTISHIGGRLPPSVIASSINGAESEREAAAASWRRTEDGRRHSALLSRPLSIKRKPPPLPPKRWGGVWDRDVIQERLKRSFNLLDEEGQESSRSDGQPASHSGWLRNTSQSVMPGSLSTVTEDEPTWEVVGQETRATPAAETNPTWRTVGRDDDHIAARSIPRFVAPASNAPSNVHDAGVNERTPYIYSEADFSLTRRPPPPPPRFPAARSSQTTQQTLESTEGSPYPSGITPKPEVGPRVSLQRTPAVRRPQSMLAHRQDNASEGRGSPEIVRSPPPSPEIRRQLSYRSRHVYSNSVPNATSPLTPQASAKPPARRPLPPVPVDALDDSNTVASQAQQTFQDNAATSSSPGRTSHPDNSSSRPPVQEYTDLEVMLANMEDQAPGAVSQHDPSIIQLFTDSSRQTSQVLREVLGVAQPATPEEIDSLPVGRVELERRRVDKKGKIKQKLSCVGINCNKCKICLQQFKEDELAVVLPVCLEVFHAEPCMRAYLATNNKCPSCQAPLM